MLNYIVSYSFISIEEFEIVREMMTSFIMFSLITNGGLHIDDDGWKICFVDNVKYSRIDGYRFRASIQSDLYPVYES